MDKRLLLLVMLFLVLGCAGKSSTTKIEKDAIGVRITAFEPDIAEVTAGKPVTLRLQLKNVGDFAAGNIKAKLTKLADFTATNPSSKEQGFETLNPPDLVAGIAGEVNEKYFQLNAPALLKNNQEVTQAIGVKVFFDYKSEARADFPLLLRETYKEYQQKGKLPEPTYSSSVGPVSLKFHVPEATLTDASFTIKLDAEKVAEGYVDAGGITGADGTGLGTLTSLVLTYDPNTLTQNGDCDFSADGNGKREVTGDDLKLWQNGKRSYSCDFTAAAPTKEESYPSVSAVATYTYVVEKTTPVKVVGAGVTEQKIEKKEGIYFLSNPEMMTVEVGRQFTLPTWANTHLENTKVVCTKDDTTVSSEPVCTSTECAGIRMTLSAEGTYTCYAKDGSQRSPQALIVDVKVPELHVSLTAGSQKVSDEATPLKVSVEEKVQLDYVNAPEGSTSATYKLILVKEGVEEMPSTTPPPTTPVLEGGPITSGGTLPITKVTPGAYLLDIMFGNVKKTFELIFTPVPAAPSEALPILKTSPSVRPPVVTKEDGKCDYTDETGNKHMLLINQLEQKQYPTEDVVDCGCEFLPRELKAGGGQQRSYAVRLPMDKELANQCLAKAVNSCHKAVAPTWHASTLHPNFMCYENVYFPDSPTASGYVIVENAIPELLLNTKDAGVEYFSYKDAMHRDVFSGSEFSNWYWSLDSNSEVLGQNYWALSEALSKEYTKMPQDNRRDLTLPRLSTRGENGKKVRAEILFEDTAGSKNAITLHVYESGIGSDCEEGFYNWFFLDDKTVNNCMADLIGGCYNYGGFTSGSLYRESDPVGIKCSVVNTREVSTPKTLGELYPKDRIGSGSGKLPDVNWIEHEGRDYKPSTGDDGNTPFTRGVSEIWYTDPLGRNDVKIITKEPRIGECTLPTLSSQIDGKAEVLLPANTEDAKQCLALAISKCHEAFNTKGTAPTFENTNNLCYKVYAHGTMYGSYEEYVNKKQGLNELVFLVSARREELGAEKAPRYVQYLNSIIGVKDVDGKISIYIPPKGYYSPKPFIHVAEIKSGGEIEAGGSNKVVLDVHPEIVYRKGDNTLITDDGLRKYISSCFEAANAGYVGKTQFCHKEAVFVIPAPIEISMIMPKYDYDTKKIKDIKIVYNGKIYWPSKGTEDFTIAAGRIKLKSVAPTLDYNYIEITPI